MLDWKDHSYCSSLTAIRRAAQTYVEIKTPLPLDSGILIMYWESALREWFLLPDLCLLRCWATDLSTSTLAQSYPFLNPGYRQVCVNFGYQDFWRLKIISNEKGLGFLLLQEWKPAVDSKRSYLWPTFSTLKESWLITEFYLFMKSSRGAIKGKLRIISEKSSW